MGIEAALRLVWTQTRFSVWLAEVSIRAPQRRNPHP